MDNFLKRIEDFNEMNKKLSDPQSIRTDPNDYEDKIICYEFLCPEEWEYFKQIWGQLLPCWVERIKEGVWTYCISLSAQMPSERLYVVKFLVSNLGASHLLAVYPPECISFKINIVSEGQVDECKDLSHPAKEYVELFVKKYQDEWDEADFLNLEKALLQKAPAMQKEILRPFLAHEERVYLYKRFCDKFESQGVTTVDGYLVTFSSIVNEKINFFENAKKHPFGQDGLKEMVKKTARLAKELSFFKKILRERLKEENIGVSKLSEVIDLITKANENLAIKRFEENLRSGQRFLIQDVDQMSGYEFEGFLRGLFERMGYQVKQTTLSNDQGADLVVTKLSEITVVQAKRSQGKIGNKSVQEVVASVKHYAAQKGAVITNSEFTRSAIELAKSNQIELIDREKLTALIKEYF